MAGKSFSCYIAKDITMPVDSYNCAVLIINVILRFGFWNVTHLYFLYTRPRVKKVDWYMNFAPQIRSSGPHP